MAKNFLKKQFMYGGLILGLNVSLVNADGFSLSREYVSWRNSKIEKEVRDFFEIYDINRDGFVELSELNGSVEEYPLFQGRFFRDGKKHDFEKFLDYYDLNLDGFLDYRECLGSSISSYDSIDIYRIEEQDEEFYEEDEDNHPR